MPERLRSLLSQSPYLKKVAAFTLEHEAQDSAHDIAHFVRVLGNALEISQAEGGDTEVLAIAALLHDLKTYPKGHPDAKQSSQLAADYAKDFLTSIDYPADKMSLVYDAILNHSFSRGAVPETLEGKILQDADRLDAVGVMGIARCLMTASKMGSELYSVEDPLMESGREPNDRRYAIDHFYQKLFKLPNLMQTESGKKLAKRRIDFMRQFLSELGEEARVELLRELL